MGTMTLEHLAARLELLAAWRTPGAPTPSGLFPIGEHLYLRDAAQRLLRLAADLELATATGQKGDDWRHWALMTPNDHIACATSLGRRDMCDQLRTLVRDGETGARNLVLRPLYIGR